MDTNKSKRRQKNPNQKEEVVSVHAAQTTTSDKTSRSALLLVLNEK
jgi:hypothetical protein